MRKGQVVIGILLAGIAGLTWVFVLRLCRHTQESPSAPSTVAAQMEESALDDEVSTLAPGQGSAVPKLNLAVMADTNTRTEVSRGQEPGRTESPAEPPVVESLVDFSRNYVEQLKSSGPAPELVKQIGAKLLTAWKEKGPSELQALAHFEGPECYAGGCVITTTVDRPERMFDVWSEFFTGSGFASMNGSKRMWHPTNQDPEPSNQMTFIIYSDSDGPPRIL